MPNEVVFDIGDATNQFYMVKQGELLVESIVHIEEENSFPTGLEKWESQTTKREVLFQVHELKVGEIFGLQEIIEQLEKNKADDFESPDAVAEMPDVPR